jgi:biopolymer transport protein ExbD
MSASVSDEGVDVNLTPLLDLVLQLIMFFMITIRLVQYETSNEDIDLPSAALTATKDDDKKINRFPVWVNVAGNGHLVGVSMERDADGNEIKVFVPTRTNREDPAFAKQKDEVRSKIERFFKRQRTEIDEKARVMGLPKDGWKVGVVIRADRHLRYDDLFTVMDMVQACNFDFWQVSVLNTGS